MNKNVEHLQKLLEYIRSIGFWSRLFRWKRIKDHLIDATGDLERLLAIQANAELEIAAAKQSISDLNKDITISRGDAIKKQSEIERLTLQASEDSSNILSISTDLSALRTALKNEQEKNIGLSNKIDLLTLKEEYLTSEVKRLHGDARANLEAIDKITARKNELEIEFASLKEALEHAEIGLKDTRDHLLILQNDDEIRRQQQREEMATLKQLQEKVQADHAQEINIRHEAEIERLKNLKNTWIHHQENVKQMLNLLCNRHTIQYISKVPFKGDPDNTISICEEYIVFDAKSPKGEDLTNFPTYIKEQAEKAKKYANEENVKNWIFFVVPINTLDVIKTFAYHLADYQVFVITVDALEPILLSLQKIEEYEFAEQISPEDRENICRILGKFAHLSKRRIQIDTYFINQFMELAYKCESDLPSDVLEKAIEFERAEKLNPPQEKRAKAIPIGDLEKSATKVLSDAQNNGILVERTKLDEALNQVPLYNKE